MRISDDDDELDASSVAFRSEAGVEYEAGPSTFVAKVDADYVAFDNPDFTDRWRFRAATWWEGPLSPDLNLRLRVDGAQRIPGAEFFDIDQLEAGARLEYEPVRAHRARLDLRWREREYNEDGEIDATGSGPEMRAEYRHRLGRYHYLQAEGRYEEIDATDEVRSYSRWRGIVSYTRPITRDLRVRPSIEYRETDFPGRVLADGDFRRDRLWTPEVELLWWPGDWRMRAGAAYLQRSSTDPQRDRDGFRFAASLGYVF